MNKAHSLLGLQHKPRLDRQYDIVKGAHDLAGGMGETKGLPWCNGRAEGTGEVSHQTWQHSGR
jgi:hypothetical protein